MKKFFVLILSVIMLSAISVSWYNVSANKTSDEISSPTNLLITEGKSNAITNDQLSDLPQASESTISATAIPITESGSLESAGLLENSLPQTATNTYGNGRSQGGQTSTNDAGINSSTQELTTITGIVSTYVAPQLTLTTNEGQEIIIQVRNLISTDGSTLNLTPGEQVTITGWYNNLGSMTANQIFLHATGTTFTTSNQTGRPEWAGKGQGNQNK